MYTSIVVQLIKELVVVCTKIVQHCKSEKNSDIFQAPKTFFERILPAFFKNSAFCLVFFFQKDENFYAKILITCVHEKLFRI